MEDKCRILCGRRKNQKFEILQQPLFKSPLGKLQTLFYTIRESLLYFPGCKYNSIFYLTSILSILFAVTNNIYNHSKQQHQLPIT